ncbi:nuclear transport factor 2 family protein [Ekhidna sp. To15]|uniref:nuclear transport factor 2 family protein n=1 Tax=Ekhidna sp. To15 TaxID=3395267 RepID=UPI003F522C20
MIKSIFFLLGMSLFAVAAAQTENEIKKTVTSYAKAGDKQDVSILKSLLHDQHRLVWHDGSKAPFILDKTGYISKIAAKEWGGDERKITIESVENFDGVKVTVKAVLDGKKSQMRSIFSLIKVEGEWKIIEELVNATFKS